LKVVILTNLIFGLNFYCTYVLKNSQVEKIRDTLNFPYFSKLDEVNSEECNPDEDITSATSLTIFTSFDYSEDKAQINNNTLVGVRTIEGRINFILYTDCSSARQMGESAKWTVRPVPKTHVGIPVLSSMFLEAMSTLTTHFYLYMNADILFDSDLMVTLNKVQSYLEARNMSRHPLLMVGRRKNVETISSSGLTTDNKWRTIIQRSYLNFKLFQNDALDYFIVNRYFLWENIPKFVIGRVGFDNWLMTYARMHNYVTVDATASILAVHQTRSGQNHEGFTHNFTTYNIDIIQGLKLPYIYWKWGRTDCCLLKTEYKFNCFEVLIKVRKELPRYCMDME